MTFEDSEVRDFRTFMRLVDHLRALPIWDRKPREFTVRHSFGSSENPVSREGQLPRFEGFADSDLMALSTLLRQFWMKGERVYFNKISGILMKHEGELRPDIVEWVKLVRQEWKETLESNGAVMVTIKKKRYTANDALDLWFYSGVFHTEADKERTYLGLSDLGRGTVLVLLQRSIGPMVRCLCKLDSLLHIVLDRPDLDIPGAEDHHAV
ncbi:MAG: hypothetical protein DWP92_05110 [Armatimonadetes bacterium]|nr:MAG: hypothetical protein DWP92_05110 [Armatimonadota bacterium]